MKPEILRDIYEKEGITSSDLQESFTQLEQIMDSVSQILVELDCLDSVQADVLRLSDAVTTVESSIKSQ